MMMIGTRKVLLNAPVAKIEPVYDPLAVDWAARVVANGGADPSAATKQAVSDFVAALRSANILSKMLAVCCLTPGSLVEALTPLIKTSGGAAYGTELVTNGTFTSNTSGWTSANGATLGLISGVSGNGLEVQGDYVNPNPQARQTISTAPGVRYKLSFFHKQPGAGVGKVLIGTTAGGGDLYTSPDLTGGTWQQITAYFTATSTATYISLGPPNAGSNYWFDSVSCQVAVLCNDPWTNNNFVSGDLTVNGLAGNGSTKYLATGFNPVNGFGDDVSAGLTFYQYFKAPAYTWDFSTGVDKMSLFNYSGKDYVDIWGGANGRVNVVEHVNGYLSGNRIADNDLALYRANSTNTHSKLGQNTNVNSVARQNNELAAFGSAVPPATFSAGRMSLFAVHNGLTESESAAFYNAIQAFRTALGGGYT